MSGNSISNWSTNRGQALEPTDDSSTHCASGSPQSSAGGKKPIWLPRAQCNDRNEQGAKGKVRERIKEMRVGEARTDSTVIGKIS